MRLGSIEKKNSLKSKWWSCYNIFSKEASQKVIFRITYLYTRLHIMRKDKMRQEHTNSCKGDQGCWSESRWNTSILCSVQMWYENHCGHKQGHSGRWSTMPFTMLHKLYKTKHKRRTAQKHRPCKWSWQHSRINIWKVARIDKTIPNEKQLLRWLHYLSILIW